jgi:leucyl aminopeptidase
MQKARDLGSETVATVTLGTGCGNLSMAESGRAIAEGTLLGLYQYHGQKSSVPNAYVLNTLLVSINSPDDEVDVNAGIKIGKAFADGAILTRNLVNLPPNICTPTFLGD